MHEFAVSTQFSTFIKQTERVKWWRQAVSGPWQSIYTKHDMQRHEYWAYIVTNCFLFFNFILLRTYHKREGEDCIFLIKETSCAFVFCFFLSATASHKPTVCQDLCGLDNSGAVKVILNHCNHSPEGHIKTEIYNNSNPKMSPGFHTCACNCQTVKTQS